MSGTHPPQGARVASRIARISLALYATRRFVGRRSLQVTETQSARGIPLLVFTSSFDIYLVTHPEFRRDPMVRATGDFLRQAARGTIGLA